MNSTPQYLKATPEELRLIEDILARPVFHRLDAGELEVVGSDDWSDVPDLGEIGDGPAIHVSVSVYRRLKAASARERTTPDALASQWLSEKLGHGRA